MKNVLSLIYIAWARERNLVRTKRSRTLLTILPAGATRHWITLWRRKVLLRRHPKILLLRWLTEILLRRHPKVLLRRHPKVLLWRRPKVLLLLRWLTEI